MAQPIESLAAMMAGGGGMPPTDPSMMMPGGDMAMPGGGGEMLPCPLCMGSGMVDQATMEMLGGGMPQSLAMRQPPQLTPMPAPQGGGMMPPMMGR